MDLHLFSAYCFAVAVLVLMPGPIVTLVIANSLSAGTRSGLTTVAGASIGNAMLLCATAVGLVAFFALLRGIFEAVRWAGALYLMWLGLKAWRSRDARGLAIAASASPSGRAVFLQGFLIAITNPKALLFYIAFLPQFIDSHRAAEPQLLLMIGTMILMALLSDSAYALLAGQVRGWFATPERQRLQSRITGTFLICVGCGLLLARRAT